MSSKTIEQLGKEARDFFSSLRYKCYDSFPLVTKDPTLLFVNSSMAPFKPDLIDGETIKKTFIVQQCFRNHYKEGYLFTFHMLGLLGDIGQMENMQDEFLDFLVNKAGISKERLHVVLDPSDELLSAYCNGRFPSTHIHYSKGNTDMYSTRWDFGEQGLLTGYGLTVVAELTDKKKCTAACDIFCPCNYFFPIGNFIIIESAKSSRSYIEIGFGLEGMTAALQHGDYYELEPYRSLIIEFLRLDFSVDEAKFLARCYVGGAVLCEHKVRPSNKQEGYILKRIIRSIFEMLFGKYGHIAVFGETIKKIIQPDRFISIKGLHELLDFIKDESTKYVVVIKEAEKKIIRYLRSKQPISSPELVKELKATFGIPEKIIEIYLRNI